MSRFNYFVRETVISLRRNLLMTLAGIMTVAISLFLFGGILLADEPTGNLDPATTVGIMRLLDRINRTGTTVVMATHDQRIVDAMRRRVLELDRCQLVRDQARGVYGVGS